MRYVFSATWDNKTDLSDGASKHARIASISNGRMSGLDGQSSKLVLPVTTAWAPREDHFNYGEVCKC